MSALATKAVSVVIKDKPIISDATCATRPGEICGLVGPNGAGKSTLLRAMCRLLHPQSGSVTLGGVDVAGIPRQAFARRVAYLPQGNVVHWRLDVTSLVGLGRLPHRAPFAAPSDNDRRAVSEALHRADVVKLADRSVDTLSGGERARALLARVLAVQAEIILADEPVASLDPYHALHVMELLRELSRDGRAIMVVLHDLALAMRYCDRLFLMHEGRITAEGAPEQVLSQERLARNYNIEGHYGEFDSQRFLVPWRRLKQPESPAC
jgi:iron complex transport system ATP-binding protein